MSEPDEERAAELSRREPEVDENPLCWSCGRKLADYATRPWRMRCSRCKALMRAEPGQRPICYRL